MNVNKVRIFKGRDYFELEYLGGMLNGSGGIWTLSVKTSGNITVFILTDSWSQVYISLTYLTRIYQIVGFYSIIIILKNYKIMFIIKHLDNIHEQRKTIFSFIPCWYILAFPSCLFFFLLCMYFNQNMILVCI